MGGGQTQSRCSMNGGGWKKQTAIWRLGEVKLEFCCVTLDQSLNLTEH